MNFYTLTSKIIKKRILLIFFIVIGLFILVDMFLYFYVDMKTNKNFFIGEKSSKIKHFHLNNEEDRDIVFIGSSRTYYHISTNYFKENGYSIYNFGASGNFLEDYPSFVTEAIKQNPKNIAISVSISDLYKTIKEVESPLLSDLKFYYSFEDKTIFINSFINWIKSLHLFFSYSETILLKIKSTYDKFFILKKDTLKNHNSIKSFDVDCKIFDKSIIGNKVTLKCTNGDGILIGDSLMLETKENGLKQINQQTLLILNNLIGQIQKVGIQPIVIFEPVFNNQIEYKIDFLNSTKYFDFTHLDIPSLYWIDNRHLNNDGRLFYTKALLKDFDNANK